MQNVQQHLAKNFVYSDQVGEVIQLGLETSRNVLLWGAAGHGKSMMAEAAIQGYGWGNDLFIQSFGEGMDESRLFGGLNLKRMNEDSILEYDAERSFLNHQVAIFEELFDAPSVVLLALKDTLTARELRNGAQRFPMKTKSIIGITNRSPSEISDLGPSQHALVERFPLQLEVDWPTYDSVSYHNLFSKVKPRGSAFIKRVLAGACESAMQKGGFVSPRTAVHALELCLHAGKDHISAFRCLRYIPEFASVVDTIQQEAEAATLKEKARGDLDRFVKIYHIMVDAFSDAKKAEDYMVTAQAVGAHIPEIHAVSVPDDMAQERSEIADHFTDLHRKCEDAAMNFLRQSALGSK